MDHDFNEVPPPQRPQTNLIRFPDGTLYGTTEAGGVYGYGTVFKRSPAGEVTLLHSFNTGDDGAHPHGRLIRGSDGALYATTVSGGSHGAGTIVKWNGTALETLHSFNLSADGANPYGGVMQGSDGALYGTTSSGGSFNVGTLFKWTPGDGLTTLHAFSDSDGASPYAGVIQGTDGALYGTTAQGGPALVGTIFKVGRFGSHDAALVQLQ